MRWFKPRVRYSTRLTEPGADACRLLTSVDRGNVTPVQRELVTRLGAVPDPTWSTLALWACLNELQDSVITAASEVRVEQGWVDGPDAFCISYTPPYQPGHRVGLRHHASDDVEGYVYGLTSVLYLEYIEMAPHEAPLREEISHPVAFGVAVAAFEIGDPGTLDPLRVDKDGVGWWGTLEADLPIPGSDPLPNRNA